MKLSPHDDEVAAGMDSDSGIMDSDIGDVLAERQRIQRDEHCETLAQQDFAGRIQGGIRVQPNGMDSQHSFFTREPGLSGGGDCLTEDLNGAGQLDVAVRCRFHRNMVTRQREISVEIVIREEGILI